MDYPCAVGWRFLGGYPKVTIAFMSNYFINLAYKLGKLSLTTVVQGIS